jgi:hypothetical protein
MKTTKTRRVERMGCEQGRRTGRSLRDSIVVLDFGRPVELRRRSHVRYGVSLFRRKGFASVSAVLRASKAYARGLLRCSNGLRNAHARIAIGTTNWGPDVTWGHGRAWAGVVNEANEWAQRSGHSARVDFAGADDIELSWNGPGRSKRWVSGYESAALHPFYNYGTADACPPKGNCAGAWTLEDVWYVSWGAPHAWALPEIYTPNNSNARQWYHLVLYSYARHGAAMQIAGVMSQRGACRRATDSCRGMNNTPSRAWRQLSNLLNSDPRTRQSIRWSTDIR